MLYYDIYSTDLNKIVNGKDYLGGFIVKNNKIYFTTIKDNGFIYKELSIYKANLDGTDAECLFSKNDYRYIRVQEFKNIIYIEYKEKLFTK